MTEYICYCFKHTADDLERDVVENGKSTIMEQIIADSKNNNCNCERNNPKGR